MGETCRNGGSCNYDMTMETYSCSCGDGFQGNTCETGEISFVCVGIFSLEFIYSHLSIYYFSLLPVVICPRHSQMRDL